MKTYSDYLSGIFPGMKVQKISIDAGFTCPNRDGSLSYGGCIYCRNDSFSPSYCNPSDSISTQLAKGRKFFARKYPDMKYLAYFQSYTGTYNKNIEIISSLYKEAIQHQDIVGLVIATRPDCIDEKVLKVLAEINERKPVIIELGAETSHDNTLRLINRNHTWEQVEEAVKRISSYGIRCGIHLIAGLPGENEEKIIETIEKAISLPIDTIKLHHLQVLKGTLLHEKLLKCEISIPDFSLEEYLSLCARIIKIVPDNIVIERFLSQSPPEMVVSPSWGLKNYEFMNKLAKLIN
ncbi:MAG: TIGR01212 family radical SAM protein [Muribaculaceae bacterium]|nr:TIGR01212 family radical SAM protein [Muribaculaceae bacterium]